MGDEARTSAGDDRASLDELSRTECLALLASQVVGRLAVGGPGQAPLVVPVNYRLDGETVVFRTDPGEKLRGLARWPASFEVDEFDHYHRTGWSVLASGTARQLRAEEASRLVLVPWAPGEKRIWIRLDLVVVTGRRLTLEILEGDDRGYL